MDAVAPPGLLPLLQTAVEMRFDCKTWEEIGQRVGRNARTCRRWPLLYRLDWSRHYAALRSSYLMDSCREILARLRTHMRSDNPNISLAATRHLDKNCQKLLSPHEAGDQEVRDAETQEVLSLLAQVKGLNHGQLAQVLEAVLEDLRSHDSGNGAGSPTPPPPQPQ